ncbi:MAG: GNAT family N-acetyltransferase [Candidatus Krumholzibacteriia bacterium]
MRELIRSGKLPLRDTVKAEDAEAIRRLTAATEFFRPDEVEIAAELASERLARGLESGYHFLFAEGRKGLLGYSCFGPIPCSTVSWDLYWIAVDPEVQGLGLGHYLLQATEAKVRAEGGRALYAETSGRSLYRPTRWFYRREAYEEAAVLADFYAEDDPKVIFVKKLV